MKPRRGEGDGGARTGLWHGVAWHGMAWRGMAWHGSAACPGDHVAGEEVQTPRIPIPSRAASGGARCGSIRETKKL